MGGRAFAERFGEGPAAVVALHGWARTRQDWQATLEGYDALALDLPGFGATPAPETGWSTSEYADWIGEILADLDRPVLVGHSFGGRVAVQLAAASPELVRGLVLTGVPLLRQQASGKKPPLAYRVVHTLHRRGLVGEDRMEEMRRKHGSADYRAARGVMRDVLVKAVNEDYTDELDEIRVHRAPVEMIWGEHDTAAPADMARHAQELLGDAAHLVVVPEAAHLLDAALAPEIRAAVDRLRAAA